MLRKQRIKGEEPQQEEEMISLLEFQKRLLKASDTYTNFERGSPFY